MGLAPNEDYPSDSNDARRQADMLIKPEEENRDHWTKVSTDTFVQWSVNEASLDDSITGR
jgi:hypothetical protein